MPPVINKDRCIGCGRCVDLCQMDVFFGSRNKEVPTVRFAEECWHCNACVIECPVEDAIRLRIPIALSTLYR